MKDEELTIDEMNELIALSMRLYCLGKLPNTKRYIELLVKDMRAEIRWAKAS